MPLDTRSFSEHVFVKSTIAWPTLQTCWHLKFTLGLFDSCQARVGTNLRGRYQPGNAQGAPGFTKVISIDVLWTKFSQLFLMTRVFDLSIRLSNIWQIAPCARESAMAANLILYANCLSLTASHGLNNNKNTMDRRPESDMTCTGFDNSNKIILKSCRTWGLTYQSGVYVVQGRLINSPKIQLKDNTY